MKKPIPEISLIMVTCHQLKVLRLFDQTLLTSHGTSNRVSQVWIQQKLSVIQPRPCIITPTICTGHVCTRVNKYCITRVCTRQTRFQSQVSSDLIQSNHLERMSIQSQGNKVRRGNLTFKTDFQTKHRSQRLAV